MMLTTHSSCLSYPALQRYLVDVAARLTHPDVEVHWEDNSHGEITIIIERKTIVKFQAVEMVTESEAEPSAPADVPVGRFAKPHTWI